MDAGSRKTGRSERKREADRLTTLSSYKVLDKAPDTAFDRITHLVADMFSAPLASISLVDADKEWFKSAVGFTELELDRDVSICAQAIESDEPLVVEDAALDSRFASNPLVSGEPFIRFYAGAPLIAPNGKILGALWIADRVPRFGMAANHMKQLTSMAGIVMSEMELSREIGLREQAQKNAAIARSNLDLTLALSDIASFRIDMETGLIEWGGAYMKIWGDDAGEAVSELTNALDRVHRLFRIKRPTDVDRYKQGYNPQRRPAGAAQAAHPRTSSSSAQSFRDPAIDHDADQRFGHLD